MGELWRRLHYLWHRKRLQRELEDEMAAHREMMGDRAPDFGRALKLREESNEAWGFGWLDRLWQDIDYGIRILRRAPGFTLTAVAVLALGIGLNVTAFSFLNFIAFRPLPVKDPHSLMRLTRKGPESSSSNVSYPAYEFYQRHNKVFRSLLAVAHVELTYENNERLKARFVTRNFLQELGALPAYGRLLRPDDTEPGMVVLSYEFFERRFGGDTSAIGKRVLLNRKPARIIGVLESGFRGLDSEKTEFWSAIEDHPYFFERSEFLTSAFMQPLHLYGYLAAGVSPKSAEAAMRPIVAARREIAPDEIWKNEWLNLAPGAYVERLDEDALPVLAVAGSLLLLVLATACANLSNLLLARGVSREREISIRTSVGASPARVVRQLMTESLLLAALGALAGLALSAGFGKALMLAADVPFYIDLSPDWRVVAFTCGMALFAALVFGLAPALQATRTNARRAARMRMVLIGVQAAASCVLLVLAGLLTRGLGQAFTMDPGFEYRQSAIIDPNLYSIGRKGAAARLHMQELRNRISRIPGVESVAVTIIPPLGGRNSSRITPAGVVAMNSIDQNYFETMRIPVRKGRVFRDGERDVVMFSERAASRLWPGEDAIGKEFPSGKGGGRWTVVGVAANAPIHNLGDPDAMEMYQPISDAEMQDATLIVRTSGLDAVRKALQQTAEEVESTVIPEVWAIREGLEKRLVSTRGAALGASSLGIVALLLAVVGFAGLISFVVTQRTREFGIRLALGATRFEVMRLGVSRLALPTCVGLAAGLITAGFAAQAFRSMLFGVSSLDPATFVSAPVLFAVLALLASIAPLRRAAKVDPATALRHD